MELKVIKKEECKTTSWSGGTTTELMIFPPESEYIRRNFKWRLSSASVQVEESIFTSLPGISRIIMVLEGKLTLEHEGHHGAFLKAFEQDSFKGEWTTRSFGKVIDFNLMMAEGCKGCLEVLSIQNNDSLSVSIGEKLSTEGYKYKAEAIYCVSGESQILSETAEIEKIIEGDMVLITSKVDEMEHIVTFYNSGDVSAKLVRSTIYY